MELNKEKLGNKRKDYLNWDEFFMYIACLSSARSKDPNTQVGACIVSSTNRVLSIGYNGAPNNFNDDIFPWDREGVKIETKYPYVCHAELNAILNFPGNKKDLEDSKIYVDLFPCPECAKAIVQVGIKHVIYLNDKYEGTDDNKAAKHIFDVCKVKYEKLDTTKHSKITLSLNSKNKVEL